MFKSSNTVNIDSSLLDNPNFAKIFSNDQEDSFSRWVLRPLAVLSAAGMIIAGFVAGAFVLLLALALLPLLGLLMWAMKTKFERAAAKANPVVDTQENAGTRPDAEMPNAG